MTHFLNRVTLKFVPRPAFIPRSFADQEIREWDDKVPTSPVPNESSDHCQEEAINLLEAMPNLSRYPSPSRPHPQTPL